MPATKDMVYESVSLSSNSVDARNNAASDSTVSVTSKQVAPFGQKGPVRSVCHPVVSKLVQPVVPSAKSPLGTTFVAAGGEEAVAVTVVVVVTAVEVKVVMEVEMETPSVSTVVTVCHAVTVTLGVIVEKEVCTSQYGSQEENAGEKRTTVSVVEPAVAVTVTVLAGTLMQPHALVIRSGEYDTHFMHRGGSGVPTGTWRFRGWTEELGVTVVVVVSVSVAVAVVVVVVTVVDEATVVE